MRNVFAKRFGDSSARTYHPDGEREVDALLG
jgi:hypothetical protein